MYCSLKGWLLLNSDYVLKCWISRTVILFVFLNVSQLPFYKGQFTPFLIRHRKNDFILLHLLFPKWCEKHVSNSTKTESCMWLRVHCITHFIFMKHYLRTLMIVIFFLKKKINKMSYLMKRFFNISELTNWNLSIWNIFENIAILKCA